MRTIWFEKLKVVVHVCTQVATTGITELTTSFGIMLGRKPNVRPLHDFGSRFGYKVRKASKSKLCPPMCEAVLIVESSGTTGYQLWDIEKRKVIISRDVQFDVHGEARKHHFIQDNMMMEERASLTWLWTEQMKKLMKNSWRANKNLTSILKQKKKPVQSINRNCEGHSVWSVCLIDINHLLY